VHRRAPRVEVRLLEQLAIAVLEGVVHKDVDAAEGGHGFVDRGSTRLGIGDVELGAHRLAAEGLDLVGDGYDVRCGPSTDDDVCPVLGQLERDVATHAGSDPGNKGDPAVEQSHRHPFSSSSGTTSAANARI